MSKNAGWLILWWGKLGGDHTWIARLLKESAIMSLKYRAKEKRAVINPALIHDHCGFLITLRTWGNNSKARVNHKNSTNLLWKSVHLKTKGNSFTYRRRRWQEKKWSKTIRMKFVKMSNCWKTQKCQNPLWNYLIYSFA